VRIDKEDWGRYTTSYTRTGGASFRWQLISNPT